MNMDRVQMPLSAVHLSQAISCRAGAHGLLEQTIGYEYFSKLLVNIFARV